MDYLPICTKQLKINKNIQDQGPFWLEPFLFIFKLS